MGNEAAQRMSHSSVPQSSLVHPYVEDIYVKAVASSQKDDDPESFVVENIGSV